MLQYLGPSVQLALGLWVFHEPFGADRLVGFLLIWTACAAFTWDAVRRPRLDAPAAPAAAPRQPTIEGGTSPS
jgi:chloramphenicol-sensitive protein RarD